MKPRWRIRRPQAGRWVVLELDRRGFLYWPHAIASTWAAAMAYIEQQHQETP